MTGMTDLDTPNLLDQLLPDRHPQADFFICDVADAVLKDLIPQMEHPFYALSKKPETAIRRYEHEGKWLEVIPSVKGQATIYDKDILIYVASQIMHRINRGDRVDRRLRFNPRDLLIFVNRGTGGKDYSAFCEALDRLMGTVIKTNITTASDDQSLPMGDEEGLGGNRDQRVDLQQHPAQVGPDCLLDDNRPTQTRTHIEQSLC